MADIAFLLLIFFLVTTTIPNDKGIAQKLHSLCESPPCKVDTHERNILRVHINKDGELMVENDLTKMTALKETLKTFIDNNGDASCNYCKGNSFGNLSDNPKKAIISLSTDRATAYKNFIAVQTEMNKAYLELRQDYVKRTYNKELTKLNKLQLQQVKEAYPLLISEADIK